MRGRAKSRHGLSREKWGYSTPPPLRVSSQLGGLTVAAISAVFTAITSHNYSVRTMTRNRAHLSLLFVSFGAAPHLS